MVVFPPTVSLHCRLRSNYPYGIVINTDKFPKPGRQGLVVGSPERAEYYDSLGEWPPPVPIARYLLQFETVLRSGLLLQSPLSPFCGVHALYFLMHKARRQSFERIIDEMQRHAHRFQRADSFVSVYKTALANLKLISHSFTSIHPHSSTNVFW